MPRDLHQISQTESSQSRNRRFGKNARPYGDPVSDPSQKSPRFIPVPWPAPRDLSLQLETILPGVNDEIASDGKLVFHSVGDTGGVKGEYAQYAVAAAMVHQLQITEGADRPKFFYHIGDVVYFNGLTNHYEEQFYDPYKQYQAPIFAIPGNHDGDTRTQKGDEPDGEPSLTGFKQNFCADVAQKENGYRETMTQPYAYWSLETSLLKVIGLYSNVDGSLDSARRDDQLQWFEEELGSVKDGQWVLVAVHHPPFSLDTEHGGYNSILEDIKTAASTKGRWPDVIFSGHVHDYQRFSWRPVDRVIPCLVAGNGGYADTVRSVHKLARENPMTPVPVPLSDTPRLQEFAVTLEAYNELSPGFMKITVTADAFAGEYWAVPFNSPTLPAGGNNTKADVPTIEELDEYEQNLIQNGNAELVDSWSLSRTGNLTGNP